MSLEAMSDGGYYVPLSRSMSRCFMPISTFFAPSLNGFRWNLGKVITATNRWTDYILGKIVPGTRQKDMTGNSNWRRTGAAT